MTVLRVPSLGLFDTGYSDYHERWWLHIGPWLILK